MSSSDYQYNQAVNLWLYGGIVADGYKVVDGSIVSEGEL